MEKSHFRDERIPAVQLASADRAAILPRMYLFFSGFQVDVSFGIRSAEEPANTGRRNL